MLYFGSNIVIVSELSITWRDSNDSNDSQNAMSIQ
jgi:hypothetical protein